MAQKIKKLVLKKETISVLDDYSQSGIKGGGFTDYLAEYMTGLVSHHDPNDCINGYLNSNYSFCYCTNGQNTCETCAGQNTCANTCPNTCANSCICSGNQFCYTNKNEFTCNNCPNTVGY
jgi:hypothetical protein